MSPGDTLDIGLECRTGTGPTHLAARSGAGFGRLLQFMVILLVVIHVIVCLFLVVVVLVQQGKAGDLAGAFGGQGSQTAFGPRGASNVLTRLTTWSAVVFMLTSIGLTVTMSRATTSRSVLSGLSTPAKK